LLLSDEILDREATSKPNFAAEAARAPAAMMVAEIFRKLSAFRKDYDETVLDDIAAMLHRCMSAANADTLMRDALVMDNELRFRRPGGLKLHGMGHSSLSADEGLLLALIAASHVARSAPAMAMAKRLGVENGRVLWQAATAVARDLARAGIDVKPPKAKWPVAKPIEWPSGF
jgi:hypothetical protein